MPQVDVPGEDLQTVTFAGLELPDDEVWGDLAEKDITLEDGAVISVTCVRP